MSCVVFKLGGSLLDLPDLPVVWGHVRALCPQSAAALVVGGGTAADQVREWDRLYQLGNEWAHALALAAMRFNAEFLARILPGAEWVRSRGEVQSLPSGRVGLVDAEAFLESRAGNTPPRLPYHWDVTSDSIAAWIASAINAEELVLLKSADLPGPLTPQAAAAAGFVDPHFEHVAGRVPRVDWINARRWPLAIQPWLKQGLPISHRPLPPRSAGP